MKFLRDILTEKDGLTYCLVRVTALFSSITGLGLTGWSVFKTGAFDFKAFCEGVAVMLAATGAAIGVKAATKAEAGS